MVIPLQSSESFGLNAILLEVLKGMNASFISQMFICCWHEEEKGAKALKIIFSYVEIRGFILSHIEMIVQSFF